MNQNNISHECKSDFYDYANYSVAEWREQARKYKDVSMRYDFKQRCFYRRIVDVPGIRTGNIFVPHHPLVSYRQLNLPPCEHMKENGNV